MTWASTTSFTTLDTQDQPTAWRLLGDQDLGALDAGHWDVAVTWSGIAWQRGGGSRRVCRIVRQTCSSSPHRSGFSKQILVRPILYHPMPPHSGKWKVIHSAPGRCAGRPCHHISASLRRAVVVAYLTSMDEWLSAEPSWRWTTISDTTDPAVDPMGAIGAVPIVCTAQRHVPAPLHCVASGQPTILLPHL